MDRDCALDVGNYCQVKQVAGLEIAVAIGYRAETWQLSVV